jgi:hypothetical protein
MDENKTILCSWVIDAGSVAKPFNLWDHLDPIKGFVISVANTLEELGNPDLSVAVEDLSPFMAVSGPALRLQGALLTEMYNAGAFPKPRLLLPSVWHSHFGIRKSTKKLTLPGTKVQAKNLCIEMGYTFDVTGKSKTDLHDAALIARWDIETREGIS